jgi:predicted permease
MRTLWTRVAATFIRRRLDEQLDDEVRAHLDGLGADYERCGMSPEDARFAALRAFGGVEPMKERYRDRLTWPFVTALMQDARHAWRSLRRSPYFTVPIVLSLAFAIGANVAAFSVVNTLVLRPLPVADPESLFHITYVDDTRTSEGGNYAWFEYVRDRTRSISDVFIAHRRGNVKVIADGQTEALGGLQVSGRYFTALGISPQIGRLIGPEDESASPARVVVLSDGYWSRRFARDPRVIGRTIRVDDLPHVVIGVTPPEFFGVEVGRRVDLTVPIEAEEYRQGWVSMALIVRLAPHIAAPAAATELTTLLREFADATGGRLRDRLRPQRVELAPVVSGLPSRDTVRGRLATPAVIVSVIIGLMLLLASTNWAMLLVARASERRREVAVRLALGSTRFQVARQAVVESVLLASLAAILGYALASVVVGYLPGNGLPADLRIESDVRVLLYASGLAVATGVLFSIGPVWLTRRVDAGQLRISGATLDRQASRLGRVLVGMQVAVSLIVVIAAAFFGATLRNLRGQDMGFSDRGVVTFSLDADGTGLEGAPLRLLHERVLQRLKAVQGVESATVATVSPLSGTADGKRITIPGFEARSQDDLFANLNTVGPDYFSTFGIPVLRGRPITSDDTERSPHVALISESTARYYFGGRDPIGTPIEIRGAVTLTSEIIGVVRDVMYGDLRAGSDRIFYVPTTQRPPEGEYVFAVRTPAGREPFVMRELPAAVNAVAPDMPVLALSTLSAQIDGRVATERLLAGISGWLGLLALIPAGIGIYGIVSYTISRRTSELGLRITLGASQGSVVWLVARGTLAVITGGIIVGTVVAFSASDRLTDILFGLSPGEPGVYAAAAAILFAAGLVAALLPVLRALRIQPVVALRSE